MYVNILNVLNNIVKSFQCRNCHVSFHSIYQEVNMQMTGPPFMSYQRCWKCVSSPLQRADTLDILSYRHRMSTGKYKTFSSPHTHSHNTIFVEFPHKIDLRIFNCEYRIMQLSPPTNLTYTISASTYTYQIGNRLKITPSQKITEF